MKRFFFFSLFGWILLSTVLPEAHAKRIIIDDKDLSSHFDVVVTDPKPGETFTDQLTTSIQLDEWCGGHIMVTSEDPETTVGGDIVTNVHVVLQADCLEAGLRLFEGIRKNPRFSIEFPVRKGSITGSN